MCGVPVDARRRLPAAADRRSATASPSASRSRIRPRRSKRGAQVRRAARRGAAGHARHDHRGDAARARPRQSAGRRRPRARVGRPNGATGSRPSTSRPAPSRSARPAPAGLAGRARPARAARDRRARRAARRAGAAGAAGARRGAPLTPLAGDGLDAGSAERRLCGFFGVATLDGFGAFSRAELAAAAAVVAYVERTQIGARPPLVAARARARRRRRCADRRGDPRQPGTDAHAGRRARTAACWPRIDRTVTPAGARLLAERLAGPLTDPARSTRGSMRWPGSSTTRRCATASARRPASARRTWRARCRGSRSTAAARATSPRCATGWPPRRDVAGLLARSAAACREIAQAARRCWAALDAGLDSALAARSPTNCRSNRATAASCAPGCDAELDETRALRDESRRVIAALQARYADETGARHAARSSTTTCSAISSKCRRRPGEELLKPPLQRDASSIARPWRARCASRRPNWPSSKAGSPMPPTARWRSNLAHFDRLCADALSARPTRIKAAADALAALDVAAALAELADAADWVRPDRRRQPAPSRIEAGRHPVVEAALKRDGAALRRQRLRPVGAGERQAAGASRSSPARTWPASRPSCARTR